MIACQSMIINRELETVPSLKGRVAEATFFYVHVQVNIIIYQK